MLPLTHIGFLRSNRGAFGAAVVVLAWLALWFAVIVAALERPESRHEAEARIDVVATSRA